MRGVAGEMGVWGSSRSMVSHSVFRRRACRIFRALWTGTRSKAVTNLGKETAERLEEGWVELEVPPVDEVSSEAMVGGAAGLGASEAGGVDGIDNGKVPPLHCTWNTYNVHQNTTLHCNW